MGVDEHYSGIPEFAAFLTANTRKKKMKMIMKLHQMMFFEALFQSKEDFALREFIISTGYERRQPILKQLYLL